MIYDLIKSDELLIAESAYLDMLKIPHSDRSLRQNLMVYVYEKINKNKNNNERKEKDYNKIKREYEKLNEDHENLKKDLE